MRVKVFSSSKDRSSLGDVVTSWISTNEGVVIDGIEVRQSSDDTHHCLSIVLFYRSGGGIAAG